MIDVIVTILVVYFLYKLIFDFLVPVSKSASQIKDNFREMQRKQEEAIHRQQAGYRASNNQYTQQQQTNTTKPEGDYIDFEEVK